MKTGIQRYWQAAALTVRGVVNIVRWPATDNQARVNTAMWSLAILLAGLSVGLYVGHREWGSFFLWMNVAIMALDIYMLRRAVLGLRYRRQLSGRARRRA